MLNLQIKIKQFLEHRLSPSGSNGSLTQYPIHCCNVFMGLKSLVEDYVFCLVNWPLKAINDWKITEPLKKL